MAGWQLSVIAGKIAVLYGVGAERGTLWTGVAPGVQRQQSLI